jgi:hypothetical protein
MLIEFDAKVAQAKNPVSLQEVLSWSSKRWKLETAIGDIVLRKITELDAEDVILRIFEDCPDYTRRCEHCAHLRALIADGKADAGQRAECYELNAILKRYDIWLMMRCFDVPRIRTLDEWNALLSELTDAELDKLKPKLAELTKRGPTRDLNPDHLAKASMLGIPVSKDLTTETMTADQADVFAEAARKLTEVPDA